MKTKIINIILIAALVLCGLETFCTIMGRKALVENDFDSARFWLNLVRDKELLGLVYYKQEKYEEAYSFYKSLGDWRGMGWAYYGMGKYEEARDYFKRVNDLAGLGQVELARGNYEEARKLFNQTNEASGLGLTYLADGDYREAIRSFREAGDDLGLGLAYFAKGDMESAAAVLQKSDNSRITGIRHLLQDQMAEAAENFKNAGDDTLYAAALKSFGDYDQALALYLENNHLRGAGEVLLEMGRFAEAYDHFRRYEDNLGLAQLYQLLGDTRSAVELYEQTGNSDEAIRSFLDDGNYEAAIQYGTQALKQDPENGEVLVLVAEASRLSGETGKASALIQKLSTLPAYKTRSQILKARLLMAQGDTQSVPPLLQEAVESSGPGSLANAVMQSAAMHGWELKPPQKVITVATETKGSLGWLPWAITLLLMAGAGAGFYLYLGHRRQQHRMELESLQIKPVTKRGSDPLKDVYKIRTPASVAVVSKTETPRKTETRESPKPAASSKKEAPPPPAKPPASKGVRTLQEALGRLGVETNLAELIELAGEEASRLTVYGIYLAARAKGIQVQGIKVDFEYLLENKESLHLVFFSDENFALLESVSEEEIVLLMEPGKTEKLDKAGFHDQWNGYVVTLSKI